MGGGTPVKMEKFWHFFKASSFFGLYEKVFYLKIICVTSIVFVIIFFIVFLTAREPADLLVRT